MISGFGHRAAGRLNLPGTITTRSGGVLMRPARGGVDVDIPPDLALRIDLACNAVRICAHTPVRCQRLNSPYTVCQGPYSPGRSRHGDPVRTRHRIPSISKRRDHTTGRPRAATTGSNGSNVFHCSSVRSPRPTRRSSTTSYIEINL